MNREEADRKLLEILCQISNKEKMSWFLDCILTPAERQDLLDRIRIYVELTSTSYSQRDCASRLDVSITKITRGAANLHDPDIKKFWTQVLGKKNQAD